MLMLKHVAILALLAVPAFVRAESLSPVPVIVLGTSTSGDEPTNDQIAATVRAHVNVQDYREVKVQLIRTSDGLPSHYLAYLLSKTSHSVAFERLNLDSKFRVTSTQSSYKLEQSDLLQQPQ